MWTKIGVTFLTIPHSITSEQTQQLVSQLTSSVIRHYLNSLSSTYMCMLHMCCVHIEDDHSLWAWGLPLKLSLQKYPSHDTLVRTAAAASWPVILQVHTEHSLEDYYSESMTTDYISISKGVQRTKISGLINCLIHVYLPSELYIQFKRLSQHPNNLLPLRCAEELFESYFLVFLKADQISKKTLAIITLIFWHITFNYLLRMQ